MTDIQKSKELEIVVNNRTKIIIKKTLYQKLRIIKQLNYFLFKAEGEFDFFEK